MNLSDLREQIADMIRRDTWLFAADFAALLAVFLLGFATLIFFGA